MDSPKFNIDLRAQPGDLDKGKEIVKLYKIILSSERVKAAKIALSKKDEIKDFTENGIILYFNLFLPINFVIDMVFCRNLSDLKKDKDEMNHLVESYMKTTESCQQLPCGAPYSAEFLDLKTPEEIKYTFKSINRIEFFDELFELAEGYEPLRKTKSTKRKGKSKYDDLIPDAKKKLKIKIGGFNARDLSKKIDRFNSYLYE
jgi:hypothetical protein